jgi:hypothetical protein
MNGSIVIFLIFMFYFNLAELNSDEKDDNIGIIMDNIINILLDSYDRDEKKTSICLNLFGLDIEKFQNILADVFYQFLKQDVLIKMIKKTNICSMGKYSTGMSFEFILIY